MRSHSSFLLSFFNHIMKFDKQILLVIAAFGILVIIAIAAGLSDSMGDRQKSNDVAIQKQLYAQAEADLANAKSEMDTLRTACQTEFDRWSAAATAAEARMIEANKTAEAIRLKLAAKGTQLPLQDFPQAEK